MSDNNILDAELAEESGALRDNSDRARWASNMFLMLLALTVIRLISGYMQANLLDDINSGAVSAGDPVIQQNDIREGVIAIATFVAYIASIVLFIRWFRRAYFNLHTAGNHLEYTEGWAAGAWFVPFVNLVRPYTIMREIWVETQAWYSEEIKSPAIIGWWWGLWLTSNVVSNISSRSAFGADSDTIEGLLFSTKADMAAAALEIPALLLVIAMIRQTATFEAELQRVYVPERESENVVEALENEADNAEENPDH